MARNTKGDGSITQVKDKDGKPIANRWRVCVSLGYDLGGNRIRVQRVVKGAKSEARIERDKIRREHEQGLSLDADKVTLSSFIEVWLESRRTAGKVAESTIKNYEARLRQIEPYLGKKRLNKITAAEIERAYSQLRAKSNLSGTTLNKLHILLKSVFEKACDYDLILRNPCNKVEAPSVDKPDRKSLTKEEGSTSRTSSVGGEASAQTPASRLSGSTSCGTAKRHCCWLTGQTLRPCRTAWATRTGPSP